MSSNVALVGAAIASAYMALASGWQYISMAHHQTEQTQDRGKE